MFPIPRLPTPLIPKVNSNSILISHEETGYNYKLYEASDETELIEQFVYPPSEDTFLFLDCLLEDIHFVFSSKPQLILEMGSGSGCILTYLMQLIEISNLSLLDKEQLRPFCIAIDINEHATLQTLSTFIHNTRSSALDIVNCNLFKNFSKRPIFDLILFNPPYVPSSRIYENSSLDASWAGGENGREIIDSFLASINDMLSSTGILYMLVENSNNPEEIIRFMNRQGFAYKEVLSKKIIGESLIVFRFSRQ